MLTMREAYYKALVGTSDLLLTPLFVIVVLMVAVLIRNMLYPNDKEMKKYFLQGLTLKILGGIGVGLIYAFYYDGGDTVEFFNNATVMYDAFSNSFTDFVILITGGMHTNLPTSREYFPWMFFRSDPSSYMVGRIAGFFAVFTFDTYLPMAVLFATVSFSGIWALFTTLRKEYPALTRQFAIATLFIPSVFFWGSGVLKDSITLACVGWITYGSYNLFMKRQKVLQSIIALAIASYFCSVIKAYIILSFAPAMLFWIFLTYRDKLESKFLRTMAGPVVIFIAAFMGLTIVKRLGTEFKMYSIDNALSTAQNFQGYHEILAEKSNASGYNLGVVDGSNGSIISKIPAAINVTLFRPYIWETRNPVMLISALESFAMLLFTLRIFYKTGIWNTLKAIGGNATVFFCLFFSLFFAFCVGFTAYNFGALVRYKIPCIPFFVAGLFVLKHLTDIENEKRKEERKSF
ncbi:MAG TPA: hypothetical protein DCQ93_05725 [Bacteroidetes bacterium]|nr:hypothetical protein [Bacteroidota bacterium]